MSTTPYHALYDNETKYEQEFTANLQRCKQELASFSANAKDLICVCAPGRVNLIGEHIDYNDGFVLPMAIPLYTIIAGCKNDDPNGLCRVQTLEASLNENNRFEFKLNELNKQDRANNWRNYVLGVVANYSGNLVPFDIVIVSNVPLGSGLSSSAALEVCTYTFLENLTNDFKTKGEKALACQKAEHDYASVPCGIMDQFISTMGLKDHALLIDCRSYEATPFPLNDPDVSIVVINSNVKHQLEGSEYSTRRKQCETVAGLLGKKSLRDANMEQLDAKKSEMNDECYKRARHAITEIERTLQASKALTANDLTKFGHLMNQSHDSLRDDFNVSCDELDSLVEIARRSTGVYGSRMTGGGFGGCTVTLVKTSAVNELIANILAQYKGVPSFYVCKPCDGARKIE